MRTYAFQEFLELRCGTVTETIEDTVVGDYHRVSGIQECGLVT